jgi:hypothetical protein
MCVGGSWRRCALNIRIGRNRDFERNWRDSFCMEADDLFELFVRPLHGVGLRYMVSGSLASVHYGEPRLTLDVDLVVHLDEADIAKLVSLFPAAEYYVPPADVMLVEVNRPTRGHFNVIHLTTGQKGDFYPSRRHPYWNWAWQNRRLGQIGETTVYFAPPEYVILWKLEFFREGGGDKHLQDIRGMLHVSGETMDLHLLARACGELGLTQQWQTVQAG